MEEIQAFFRTIKDITHEMLSRFCNIEYDREAEKYLRYCFKR
jgi:hypothetical protein